MHTETFDFASTQRLPAPVRSGIVRRLVDRIRDVSVTYELDPHLARDIGVSHYAVPLLPYSGKGDLS